LLFRLASFICDRHSERIMKASGDSKIILVENPFTGNTSVGRGLGLNDVQNVDKWATPDKGREKFGAGWRDAKKVVLVREVRARFESAAAFALTNPDKYTGAFGDVLKAALKDCPSMMGKAEKLLRWLIVTPDADRPVSFRNQSNWLKGKFDVVLSTHDIAAYFNTNRLRTVLRAPLIASLPSSVKADARPWQNLLNEAYSVDIELFSKLRVWGEDPKTIRLLGGDCAVCTRKAATKEFVAIDLSAEDVDTKPANTETIVVPSATL